MASWPKALLLLLTLTAGALAGCTDDGTPDPAGPGIQGADDPLESTGLTKDSVVDAPEWHVGDYFGHHLFYGGDDNTAGYHIQTMVVEDQGSKWFLATESEQAAKWEAAWDFPMLGAIDKSDLSTTAFGSDWNIYNFPLSDGKTWTADFNPLFEGERELTMTATFGDRIETPQGFKQGFLIEGRNAEGELELKTDYIPDIRWYSDLIYYEMITEDPEDFIIHVRAMGQGVDTETPYIVASAREVVNLNTYFAPANEDLSADASGLNPPFQTTMALSEDADELYGLLFLLSLGGRSQVEMVHPSMTQFDQWGTTSTAVDQVDDLFVFVEMEDPEAGDWQFTWEGAGVVAVGYAQLWEIQYEQLLW